MKTKSTLLFFPAAIAIGILTLFTLTNQSGGAPGHYVGAPTSIGTCASCHGSGSALPGGITLTGFPTDYTPGTTYSITLSIDNSTNTNGFQGLVLDPNNNQAGTFTSGAGSQIQNFSGDNLIGHSTPSGTGSWTFDWTAPSSAMGTLTFYVAVNAANGSGTADAGDVIYADQFTSNPLPPLTASVSSTDPACYGECNASATVSASGGQSPYSYTWSSGVQGATGADERDSLCAGTHFVTVTDQANDSVVEQFTITAPDSIQVSDSIEHTACNEFNGSISLTLSGGNPPYSVVWTGPAVTGQQGTSIQNLQGGSYSAEITDDSGCVKVSNFTVLDTASGMDAIFSIIEPACDDSNGTAKITVNPQTELYTYNWSTGETGDSISGLTAGNYSVTVTGDQTGCVDSFSVSVPNLNAPDITGVQVDDVLCHGEATGSIDLTVQGSAPFQYSWSDPGATGSNPQGLPAGNYSVTVSDSAGCSAVESITIDEPQGPFAVLTDITADTNGQCIGEADIQVSGNNADSGLTYSWPGGQSGNPVTGLCEGTYEVTVTDDSGCDTVVTVEVPNEITSSVATIEKPEVTVYPNPTSGTLFLENTPADMEYQIYSSAGSLVKSGRLMQDRGQIELNQPRGIYFLRLFNGEGTEITKRIAVTK